MTTKTRASHFKYIRPAETPNVALTADDDRLLMEVYRHDIIDSKGIFALLAPRSEDSIRRRLRRLFDAGYLQRLGQAEQIYVPGGGSLSMPYTLGPRGARRLRDSFSVKAKPDRYRGRERTFSSQHVKHSLEQARFMVSARMSVMSRQGIEFLYPDEIYTRFAPHILERARLPRVVSAPVEFHQHRRIEGTIPDGFFMLHYLDKPEGKNRRSLFIEIDRGPMTIDVGERKQKTLQFWKDSSILRKFLVYGYAYRAKTHVKDFGIPTFQVVTVTTDRERIGTMQAMFQKRLAPRPHSFAPGQFLFTDFATLKAHGGDILSVPFEDGAGKVRELV